MKEFAYLLVEQEDLHTIKDLLKGKNIDVQIDSAPMMSFLQMEAKLKSEIRNIFKTF